WPHQGRSQLAVHDSLYFVTNIREQRWDVVKSEECPLQPQRLRERCGFPEKNRRARSRCGDEPVRSRLRPIHARRPLAAKRALDVDAEDLDGLLDGGERTR